MKVLVLFVVSAAAFVFTRPPSSLSLSSSSVKRSPGGPVFKKPKTASEWGYYRRPATPKATLKKAALNATKVAVNSSDVRLDWEERVKFDSMRHGNRVNQHDILRSNLCI
mmetsp:Transcript_24089/g.77672  ORF Transcript_24089/g.77672 Transcript_24089/m.77672 type:complete len:110 (-) Transcript_24089:285-614(-)